MRVFHKDEEDAPRDERVPKEVLHRTMIELMGDNRLILGPALNAKRNYHIKDMLLDFNINCFVNLLPARGQCQWYMSTRTGTLIENLQKHTDEMAPPVKCISFPMDSETPIKDDKLFAFITRLCHMLKKDPDMRMYIHDGDGTHVAASVALPLWYFMMQGGDAFDPIQAMKRRGKHHVIPDRKKDFVQQIKRMCELDDKSIHRHLFTSSGAKRRKNTDKE